MRACVRAYLLDNVIQFGTVLSCAVAFSYMRFVYVYPLLRLNSMRLKVRHRKRLQKGGGSSSNKSVQERERESERRREKRKRILLNSSVKCLMISKMHNLNGSTFYIVMVGFRFVFSFFLRGFDLFRFVSFIRSICFVSKACVCACMIP